MPVNIVGHPGQRPLLFSLKWVNQTVLFPVDVSPLIQVASSVLKTGKFRVTVGSGFKLGWITVRLGVGECFTQIKVLTKMEVPMRV